MTDISRVSSSGAYGNTRGCVFVVLSQFLVMTRSEKEKQMYKLGHNRQENKSSRFKDLLIKNKWNVHGHSRVFVSLGIEESILFFFFFFFLMIQNNFRIRIVSIYPSALS